MFTPNRPQILSGSLLFSLCLLLAVTGYAQDPVDRLIVPGRVLDIRGTNVYFSGSMEKINSVILQGGFVCDSLAIRVGDAGKRPGNDGLTVNLRCRSLADPTYQVTINYTGPYNFLYPLNPHVYYDRATDVLDIQRIPAQITGQTVLELARVKIDLRRRVLELRSFSETYVDDPISLRGSWKVVPNNLLGQGGVRSLAHYKNSAGHYILLRVLSNGWIQEYGRSDTNPTTIDTNPNTKMVVASKNAIYQLHYSGEVWRYTGTPIVGWQRLDNNPATVAIVANEDGLYQLHNNRRVWRYTGAGWQLIDSNQTSKQLVATDRDLYQLHSTGALFRYTGTGWQQIDNNPATQKIFAGGDQLYQLRNNRGLYRYRGVAGWELIDDWPLVTIAATSWKLYELDTDRKMWEWVQGRPWNNLGQLSTLTGIYAYGNTLLAYDSLGNLWALTDTNQIVKNSAAYASGTTSTESISANNQQAISK